MPSVRKVGKLIEASLPNGLRPLLFLHPTFGGKYSNLLVSEFYEDPHFSSRSYFKATYINFWKVKLSLYSSEIAMVSSSMKMTGKTIKESGISPVPKYKLKHF